VNRHSTAMVSQAWCRLSYADILARYDEISVGLSYVFDSRHKHGVPRLCHVNSIYAAATESDDYGEKKGPFGGPFRSGGCLLQGGTRILLTDGTNRRINHLWSEITGMATRDSATESAFTALASVLQQTFYLARDPRSPGIPASDRGDTSAARACVGATHPRA